MSNYNHCIEVGNLTRDVSLSYTPNKTAVADFGLAVNRKWISQDGQSKEETCYIDCRAFGKRAEACSKYLGKGSLVLVAGYLKFESWSKCFGEKDVKFSKLRLMADKVEFLPSGDRDKEPG